MTPTEVRAIVRGEIEAHERDRHAPIDITTSFRRRLTLLQRLQPQIKQHERAMHRLGDNPSDSDRLLRLAEVPGYRFGAPVHELEELARQVESGHDGPPGDGDGTTTVPAPAAPPQANP